MSGGSGDRGMSRATAEAPANIAFLKYWGARDRERTLPFNPSLSMTLSRCVSRTRVELAAAPGEDEVRLRVDGELRPAPRPFVVGVRRHLAALRDRLGAFGAARVATENTFPAGAGIASSASGFAALALAVAAAAGHEPSPEELSVLARVSGSGSAARSAMGGYVAWPAGEGEAAAHAVQVAPAGHWLLADVVAVVEEGAKSVSSREGHRRAPSSPYFERRLELLPARLAAVRAAVESRDLAALGPVLEEEAIDLHLIAMSSRPPIHYWRPATLAVLAEARRLRDDGRAAWATMDAGANVHLICEPEAEPEVARRIAAVPGVGRVIRDRVGEGPRLLEVSA